MGGVVPLLPCVRACVPACLGAPIPPARRAALTLAPLPPLPMRAPPLDPPDWNPQVRAVDACACRGTLVGCVQWRQHATAPECPCCAHHPERLPPPPSPSSFAERPAGHVSGPPHRPEGHCQHLQASAGEWGGRPWQRERRAQRGLRAPPPSPPERLAPTPPPNPSVRARPPPPPAPHARRFVTSGSVEEDILERAKRKMVLDHLVIQASRGGRMRAGDAPRVHARVVCVGGT